MWNIIGQSNEEEDEMMVTCLGYYFAITISSGITQIGPFATQQACEAQRVLIGRQMYADAKLKDMATKFMTPCWWSGD